MEDSNIILERISKAKPFLGGLFAVGILASLLILGSSSFQSAKKLKTEVTEATKIDTPTITSLTPISGKIDDLIYLTVDNLENFSKNESGVFFGEMLAEISMVETNNENEITIAVIVPQLINPGEYSVRAVTSSEIIESTNQFKFITSETEYLPLEDLETETSEDSTETLEDFENFSDTLNEEHSITPVITIVSPPQNLQAISTINGINLLWEGEAKNYQIYYGNESGMYLHRVTSKNSTKTLTKNLENGKLYFFVVSATDNFGNESVGSNEASAIFSAQLTNQPDPQIFHASSPKPPQLSEEGPAETLIISLLTAFGISFFIFRKKIFFCR